MSWSMSSIGTKEGVRRSLGDQRIYGTPGPEEQAAFDYVRDTLLKIVDSTQSPSDCRQIATFDVAAAGHGAQITGISVKVVYVWLG